MRRDKATNFNGGGTRSPDEVAIVVLRDKRANGEGVVTTTVQKVSSADGRQSGRMNQLWNRASFQNERDMDKNLIEDRTPYDSVESEIGITTNRAYQDDADYPIEEKTPPTPSTLKASLGGDANTIDMPMMSGSPSDDFLYALEHML